MKIGSLTEIGKEEARVALTPESALHLRTLGYDCVVESGAGNASGFSDEAYRAADAAVVDSADDLCAQADVNVKVRPSVPGCPAGFVGHDLAAGALLEHHRLNVDRQLDAAH